MRRINHGEIILGKPLLFDCYDENGNFLLRKGQVINSERQLETLIVRGFAPAVSSAAAGGGAPAEVSPPQENNSPFRMLESCKDHVRTLFHKLKMSLGVEIHGRVSYETLKQSYREAVRNMEGGKPSNFREDVLNVCKGIQELCRSDADAALGSVHLDLVCHYTTIHPLHKAVLCELVGARAGFSRQERVSLLAAALTANLSILELQEILYAQKTPLEKTQAEMIRLHPQMSVEMLQELGVSDELWLQAILQHHERVDGSGYWRGLKGAGISRDAQLLALADIYSAMLKPRAYRDAVHAKEILRRLYLGRDKAVETPLVENFIKVLGIYPPGSLVKLQNNELAVVTRRSNVSSSPIVGSVVDAQGKPLTTPIRRDTEKQPFAICDVVPRERVIRIDTHSLWGYMAAV